MPFTSSLMPYGLSLENLAELRPMPSPWYGSDNYTVLLAAGMGRRSFNKYFADTNV